MAPASPECSCVQVCTSLSGALQLLRPVLYPCRGDKWSSVLSGTTGEARIHRPTLIEGTSGVASCWALLGRLESTGLCGALPMHQGRLHLATLGLAISLSALFCISNSGGKVFALRRPSHVAAAPGRPHAKGSTGVVCVCTRSRAHYILRHKLRCEASGSSSVVRARASWVGPAGLSADGGGGPEHRVVDIAERRGNVPTGGLGTALSKGVT